MRVAILIVLGSLSAEACYCSHGLTDEDAGEDAAQDGGTDSPPDVRPDSGPRPTCGAPIRAAGPLCRDATCVLTDRLIVEAGFELNPEVATTPRGDVLVTYRGDDLLPMAVFRGGELVETRIAPLASFGSGAMTRAAESTFVAGREAGTNDALLIRVDETTFVDTGIDFGDDGFGWGLTGDDAGCIHLLLTSDEGVQPWTVRGELAWRGESLGGVLAHGIRIDSESRTHVVYSTRRDGEDRMLTWTSDDDIEPIDTASPTASYQARFDVAGSAPHVLYSKKEALGVPELVYASRTEAGWERTTLATGAHEGCSIDEPSTSPGETCAYERTTHHPIAVLVDQTESLRLLYGELIENTTLTAVCGGEDRPPDACGSWERDPVYTGSLHLVTVADELTDEIVTTELHAIDGHAVAFESTIHAAIEMFQPERELHYVSLALE